MDSEKRWAASNACASSDPAGPVDQQPDWPSAPSMPLLRILDANLNRALEGLRVVEEYARFVLNDSILTESYKQLRHDLVSAAGALSPEVLLAARDAAHDVGADVRTAQEYARNGMWQVLLANQKRIEQSLRCLEEYGKAVQVAFAERVEPLRYRAYSLAQAVSAMHNSRQRLEGSALYVLIDASDSLESFTRLATQLIEAGVDVLQLRDKRLSDRQLAQRARRLRQLTRGSHTLCMINDRGDIAALVAADGVHVGQDELTVAQLRRIVGPEMLVGVSTHTPDQARQAVLDGADYIGCGPTFPSPTKSFDHFPGTDYLRDVATHTGVVAFAIGGITLENLDQVMGTGFQRVAVGSAITAAGDPAAAARAFRERLPPPRVRPGDPCGDQETAG